MDFSEGVKKLAAQGLNIFASGRVAALPDELRKYLEPLGVELADYSICVLGHGGRGLWKNLAHPLDAAAHPIDNYSMQKVEEFAREALGDSAPMILFPRPGLIIPLQQLGRFFNICRPSKLGLDIHPEYGPWFAFRAVFLTRATIPEVKFENFISPCETCAAKPCIPACPVQAVQVNEGFNLQACGTQRRRPESPCRDKCLSRQACPVGQEHAYEPAQLEYHMGISKVKRA